MQLGAALRDVLSAGCQKPDAVAAGGTPSAAFAGGRPGHLEAGRYRRIPGANDVP